MWNRNGARQIREEDVRRPENPDQKRLLAGVVLGDASPELDDAGLDVRPGEVDAADAGVGPGQPEVTGGSTRRG